MPAKSRAQQKYLAAKFGSKWLKAHHFDTKGPLPARVHPKKKGHTVNERHDRSYTFK